MERTCTPISFRLIRRCIKITCMISFNHVETYVKGRVHTNGLENFWSLLKRGLNGTYVSVEPFHLSRYVDEQAFRFNNPKNSESLCRIAGRSGFGGLKPLLFGNTLCLFFF
jgi:hypothetical protein